MTFTEWLCSLPDDERGTLCLHDTWVAGANATFHALIDTGYINEAYRKDAEEKLAVILNGE